MNNEELLIRVKELEEQLKQTTDELTKTKESLATYTNNTKRYYEKNKAEIIQKVKDYKIKTNYVSPPVPKELIKERNKKAYLKRKEKLKELENVIDVEIKNIHENI
jgi:hypothetical protein